MKSALVSLICVLSLAVFLAGCAPTANQFLRTPDTHNTVAGFWLGLWHGFIAPFLLVASCSKATSASTRSTTAAPGTTSVTYSVWRASLAAAAIAPPRATRALANLRRRRHGT